MRRGRDVQRVWHAVPPLVDHETHEIDRDCVRANRIFVGAVLVERGWRPKYAIDAMGGCGFIVVRHLSC